MRRLHVLFVIFWRRSNETIAALAIALVISCPALAADVIAPRKAPPTSAIEDWTFTLTPYVWATSLNGSTTVKGRTIDVDASFIDIVEHTEFPKDLFELAAFGEVRHGRWGLLTDIVYLKVGLSPNLTRSRAVDDLNLAVGASAGLKFKMAIVDLAAAYEVSRWNGLFSPMSNTALDLYAGARAWWQHADARLAISGTIDTTGLTLTGDRTFSAAASVTWVDPIIGARIRHQFSPAWNLLVSGDVGGFGVGSKFSWQTIGALSYEFSHRKSVTWSGMLGYKALGVDYSQDSGLTHYEYDMVMHGPILGITAQF